MAAMATGGDRPSPKGRSGAEDGRHLLAYSRKNRHLKTGKNMARKWQCDDAARAAACSYSAPLSRARKNRDV